MLSAPLPVTLEEFAALNQEMATLTRAGIPLEQGLTDLSHDWQGRVGRIAEQWAEQLRRGRSLPDVLADPAIDFPPAYRAAVMAGMRSGRLASVLEGVATVATRAAESRRLTWLAFLYPMIVVAVTYSLGTFLLLWVFPTFLTFFHDLRLDINHGWTHLENLREFAVLGGWWGVPLVALAIGGWLWWRTGRASTLQSRGESPLRAWWPSLRQVNHWGRLALFADLLAVLVEHDVPLVEALPLAGDAIGDDKLAAAALALAARIRRGEAIVETAKPITNSPRWQSMETMLPPRMIWLIASGRDQKAWSLNLRRAAAAYRTRANQAIEWMSSALPVVLTVVIGGISLAIYTTFCFWPLVSLLNDLSI